MATQAYYDWLNAGRPWHAALPVTEYRNAFRAAGWPPESLGTIGDNAHLTSDHPQDHTPFSVTGYPGPNPYPYVLALDAGHLPGQGLDMGPVVARWLADVRVGKTPWVKYIVWRGQIFDVRNGFDPQSASGHFDHAHISMHTDWYDKSTGGYDVVGGVMGKQITSLNVQTALQAAGFDPGPLDDDWGARSQAALVAAFGKAGKDGLPGKDGRTPTGVRISVDGTVTAWTE